MLLSISEELRPKFKHHCSSPEAIMLFVYMKCRFSLSYRELEEMMIIRGGSVDHATIQRWVYKFTPIIDAKVRKRKKPTNGSWRMDETYIKIKGEWYFLYRAVDKYGDTIDFLLRKKRNNAAAKAFFRKSFRHNGRPDKVAIDKSGANKLALDKLNEGLEGDDKMKIMQSKYLNNMVEQDHRFIKKRTRPMLGFKNFNSARRTIGGIENVRMIQKRQITGANDSKNTYENFSALMA